MAEHQTAGRGRLGRRWHSPPGSCLTFSLLHRPATDASIDRVMLASSVGLAEAMTEALPTDVEVRIKWPNDLTVGDRKLAGILIEQAENVAVIGVGINVNLPTTDLPPQLRPKVTSLRAWAGSTDRVALLAGVVLKIERTLSESSDEELLAAWRRRCKMVGEEVRLIHNNRSYDGQVTGIDPRRGIRLRQADGSEVRLPAAGTSVATGQTARS